MKRILSVFFFISLFHLSLLAESIGKLNALRCEYLVAPLGIDVPSPRLSWQLPVDVDVQEAYQVIVGTDSVRVAQGMGDSWNSGKQTISNVLAVYAGQKLQHDITGRCVPGIVIRCIQVT
jgi:alpha-L-rhamnosidase